MIQYTKDFIRIKNAFVSDYARFCICGSCGLPDVDVELIKPPDDILNDNKVMFERIGKVNPGLICASEPNTEFLMTWWKHTGS